MARVLFLGSGAAQIKKLGTADWEMLRGPAAVRATSLARDLSPDLVIVDPGPDDPGTTLIQRLVDATAPKVVPILVVADGEAAALALTSGAWQTVSAHAAEAEFKLRVQGLLEIKGRLEHLLAETQRATLLELAGAVAHRVNQPLTSMSVIVETLISAHLRGDLSTERLVGRLGELQRLVERMAEIVRQVADLDEYRTTPYVGAVRIIDLERNDSGDGLG